MSGTEKPVNTPARQRRAERRRATYEEMLSLARDALREGRPVSLRAIAADMGMTAPALYRYVDSHAALQEVLGESILDDVLGRMREAADSWPPERHGHRLVCSLYAFRSWALSRPEEFRLVFGQPRTPEDAEATLAGRLPHRIRFTWHLMSCLAGMHRAGRVGAALDEEVPEEFRAELVRLQELCAQDGHEIDAPIGLWWTAVTHWIVLCGVVRMEVDRMPGEALVADGILFREALALCGQGIGVPADRVSETVGEAVRRC
ncbi:MAG: WHG domain-containing protein [Austwickia sp.]|jgi:AcrR family transcriptional regulator|nr:MAG: WHG domain-containing protein [Austwickia sp.]